MKWWETAGFVLVVCVFFVCVTVGLHLEQVEKTKREVEKTKQMEEQTKQFQLQDKKE